jgi:tetratricopeptide (TPR) repeat protein
MFVESHEESMPLRTLSLTVALAILVTYATPDAQERHNHPASASPKLGTVHFPNSGKPAAQEPFLRGVALLHSFEYEEAAEQFRAAQRVDPSFAMAYWGEALTYIHPLWGEDDPGAARAALGRLSATADARIAKAPTPRERAYGAAVESLFADADEKTRARGFADGMRKVVTTFPNDPEAAAFTSLALMFEASAGELTPEARRKSSADAVTFAERVFKEDPEHPGGAHYLIHATDNPELAPRGLTAARRYAEIAPDAEHALHMPSHIFVQLGLWADVVSTNERAWAASRNEIAARKLPNSELSFHALQWLQYGYLQAGRYKDARQTIVTARQVLSGIDLAKAASPDGRYTVGFLEFQQAASTGDWSGSVCNRTLVAAPSEAKESDRELGFRATTAYQTIVAAARCGRGGEVVEAARKAVESGRLDNYTTMTLRRALQHAELLAYITGTPATNLDALLADPPLTPAPVGPPSTLRLEELVGEARIKAGRLPQAVAAYEQGLRLTPNRSATLLGLARARAAAGDPRGAAEAYRKLLENWRDADLDLSALPEVRKGAAAP